MAHSLAPMLVLLMALLVLSTHAAQGPRPPVGDDKYFSCFYSQTSSSFSVVRGKLTHATAHGFFDDTFEANGAAHLFIRTNRDYPDREQMSCAGYLEGYMSAHRIKDYYRSYRQSAFPNEELYLMMRQWLDESQSWTLQTLLTPPESAELMEYWKTVGLTMTQFLSMVQGYNANTDFPLNALDFFMLNSLGDMDDLLPAMNYTLQKKKHAESVLSGSKMTHSEGTTSSSSSSMESSRLPSGASKLDFCYEPWCIMNAESNSHCSAIIKPIGGELFSAHEMWTGYYQMLMVWKEYDFSGLRMPHLHSRHIAFSSWPGMLSSEDDFYITGARLVVMETTNNVYNFTLYDRLKPSTLVSWIRAITANYMGSTSEHWHEVFKRYNSGTYNNQWMVTDMKKWHSGAKSVLPGTLVIGSQLPEFYMHADVSHFINLHGYWASYNVPYFKEAWKLAGYDIVTNLYGDQFTWENAPRAKIFRQRQGNATDMDSLKRLMRYNDWTKDPLSLNCPMNQLAARGDLSPPGNIALCYRGAFGAVNAKITNSLKTHAFDAEIVAGPTHDTQPVFSWTPQIDAMFPTGHFGQPTTWNFNWQNVRTP